jgi:single-stranded-DNA-specific exonuclease
MQWDIQHHIDHDQAAQVFKVVEMILANRGLIDPKEIDAFLYPHSPLTLSVSEVGIQEHAVKTAAAIIQQAIKTHQPIIVYGDYDADGVTATAIMWETMICLGAAAYPFIPNREKHGYGLSIKGLQDALSLVPESNTQSPLIITVDNGIVAHQPIVWLKEQDIQVIVTDHHQPASEPVAADVIIHTTELCGAGVAWMVAKELLPAIAQNTLDLACIGTISDMMPLTKANRSIVTFGLQAVRQSNRPGIAALLKESQINEQEPITPYHVNYIIAPRLNAMGRLEHALDSLRLLCTKKVDRATELATMLGDTNRNRQDLTQDLLDVAKSSLVDFQTSQKIIILDDDRYHEGVIGLIAGKLVESYYRPTILISRKSGVSKASARSVSGVNITELIRVHSDLLEGVGGHPMAAGFSIATEKIEVFKDAIIKTAETSIQIESLVPKIAIDIELPLTSLTKELFDAMQALQPFGIGNPQPIFATMGEIVSVQPLGKEGKHLKLMVTDQPGNTPMPVIWFGHGYEADSFSVGQTIQIAGTLNENVWRNRSTIQLLARDIKSLTDTQ